MYGDIVEVKELLKDAADNKDNSVDLTESTESIKREDSTEISKETAAVIASNITGFIKK